MAKNRKIVVRVFNQSEYVKGSVGRAKAVNEFVCLICIKMGLPLVTQPNVPEWVLKCFDNFWGVSFANVPVIPPVGDPSIRDKGFYLGYFQWLPKWFESLFAVFPEIEVVGLSRSAEKKIDEAWDRIFLVKGAITQKDLDELSTAEDPLDELPQELAKLPSLQSAQFYGGMAEGVLGPSGDENGEVQQSDATLIYIFLMIFWREILEMKSIKQLYALMLPFFGKNRIGRDTTRLGKLCQRIGLRLRGRGRPRK